MAIDWTKQGAIAGYGGWVVGIASIGGMFWIAYHPATQIAVNQAATEAPVSSMIPSWAFWAAPSIYGTCMLLAAIFHFKGRQPASDALQSKYEVVLGSARHWESRSNVIEGQLSKLENEKTEFQKELDECRKIKEQSAKSVEEVIRGRLVDYGLAAIGFDMLDTSEYLYAAWKRCGTSGTHLERS